MDMLIVSVIFLIGAIVYERYNTFKINKESEEMNRLYRAEIAELKRRERIKGNIE